MPITYEGFVRSSMRNPEIGGFLDDAWNVLKAASPVVNAIDAVKNAASKKEDASKAAEGAGASAAGAKPVADALKAKSAIPTWVWVFALYLIAKKA